MSGRVSALLEKCMSIQLDPTEPAPPPPAPSPTPQAVAPDAAAAATASAAAPPGTAPKKDLKALLSKVRPRPAPADAAAAPAAPAAPPAVPSQEYVIRRNPGESLGMGLSGSVACEINVVKAGLPADRAGIRQHARVVSVNGTPITTNKDFGAAVKAAGAADIRLALVPGSRGGPVPPQSAVLAAAAAAAAAAPPLPQMAASVSPPPLPPPPSEGSTAGAPAAPAAPAAAPPAAAPGAPAAGGAAAAPAYRPAPHELDAVDKFVAELGKQKRGTMEAYEKSVKSRCDPKYGFLDPIHHMHGYYKYNRQRMLDSLAALDSLADLVQPAPAAAAPAPQPLPLDEAGGGSHIRLAGRTVGSGSAADTGNQARTLTGQSAPLPAVVDWRTKEALEREAERLMDADGGASGAGASNVPLSLPPSSVQPPAGFGRMPMGPGGLPLPMFPGRNAGEGGGAGGGGGGAGYGGGPAPLTETQIRSMKMNAPRTATFAEVLESGDLSRSFSGAERLSNLSMKTDIGMMC